MENKMKKVLIINGHQKYEGFADGKLTQTIIDSVEKFLVDNSFEVIHTNIEEGYSVEDEAQKIVDADYIFFQYPVYWMSLPWITKKYFDDVLTSNQGKIYANDGRSRDDSSKKYGSGGLLKDTKYMLSLTYNCPKSEFSNKDGFFDGLSLDEANYAVHKIFQFIGAKKLDSYSMFDVYKGDLNLDKELEKLNSILTKNFLDD
jgi:modulator of drug activity B